MQKSFPQGAIIIVETNVNGLTENSDIKEIKYRMNNIKNGIYEIKKHLNNVK